MSNDPQNQNQPVKDPYSNQSSAGSVKEAPSNVGNNIRKDEPTAEKSAGSTRDESSSTYSARTSSGYTKSSNT